MGGLRSYIVLWGFFACAGLASRAPVPRESNRESDRWSDLITDYARERMEEQRRSDPDWTPRPIRVDLPYDLSGEGRGLPLIVVPLVIPLPGKSCPATRYNSERRDENYLDYEERQPPPRRSRPRPQARPRPRPAPTPAQDDEDYSDYPRVPTRVTDPPPSGESETTRYGQRVRDKPRVVKVDIRAKEDRPQEEFELPKVARVVSSKQILEEFLLQVPKAPHLPPAVLPHYRPAEEPSYPVARTYLPVPLASTHHQEAPYDPSPRTDGEPPRPKFSRSIKIKAELTVPRADYTEPYTMWWNANTGATRTDFHGGSTTTYRQPASNGRHQEIEMRIVASSGTEVRVCGVAAPAKVERHAPTALPDINLFSFGGYTTHEGAPAELWRHTAAGGGARGEALTHRHELLLARRGDEAIPLRYSVNTDSSLLGPNCDSYEHRYLEVTHEEPDYKSMTFDTNKNCDVVESLDHEDPIHAARLNPLKEFTLPTLDKRFDKIFSHFKNDFDRIYSDKTEEAVRKNLVVQSTRFITSNNRQGGPFETTLNFLGDRLDAEIRTLLGVRTDERDKGYESFPYDAAEVREQDRELEDEFDWRTKGGVTQIRNQGHCRSCWAVAVTGATEGALFIKTDRLVTLSEQTLVDCGHTHGTHGCGGTWPSFAYSYIKDRGLPAMSEYGDYKGKVQRCRDREVTPVTRISGHVNVTSAIPAIKLAIRKHAPTVVIIDAEAKSFIFYSKGVLYDDRCAKNAKRLNHAVLAVGWGVEKGATHFILKNSWSHAWGEAGYARLQAPANTCGVNTLPSYPRLEKPDVVKLP